MKVEFPCQDARKRTTRNSRYYVNYKMTVAVKILRWTCQVDLPNKNKTAKVKVGRVLCLADVQLVFNEYDV